MERGERSRERRVMEERCLAVLLISSMTVIRKGFSFFLNQGNVYSHLEEQKIPVHLLKSEKYEPPQPQPVFNRLNFLQTPLCFLTQFIFLRFHKRLRNTHDNYSVDAKVSELNFLKKCHIPTSCLSVFFPDLIAGHGSCLQLQFLSISKRSKTVLDLDGNVAGEVSKPVKNIPLDFPSTTVSEADLVRPKFRRK